MKLFLFQWPTDTSAYLDALGALKQAGHEIVYFVYSGSPNAALGRLPHALFHEHEHALDGEPANGTLKFLIPPPASLIREMAKAESIMLSMMHKHFDFMAIDERKQIYYRMLGYWHAILTHYRPGALIFPAVPHSVYDYLAYELAHRLGIRTIMFDNTVIGDRYLFLSDFRKGSEAVLASLARLERERITPEDLSPDLREYYQCSRDDSASSIPLYVTEDKKRYSFKNVLKLRGKLVARSLKDLNFLKKTVSFSLKFLGENIRKEYNSVARMPDLSKQFVYVPLNYQPECTTSPQGDIFVVQTLMLETLSAALPTGWHIYVKEHPSQWGPRGLNFSSSRYQGYYRRIARIPQVSIVPISTKSSELIKHSKAVATVSGTAGLEALLRQKPAIIFGHPWYQNAPALLKADSVESCKKCLDGVAGGRKIREEENLRFLKALEEGTVHGHFQEYSKRQSKVTSDESASAVVTVVLKALAVIT